MQEPPNPLRMPNNSWIPSPSRTMSSRAITTWRVWTSSIRTRRTSKHGWIASTSPHRTLRDRSGPGRSSSVFRPCAFGTHRIAPMNATPMTINLHGSNPSCVSTLTVKDGEYASSPMHRSWDRNYACCKMSTWSMDVHG